MILKNKKETDVYQGNTSNNKLLDFWYRYNKIIVVIGIVLILGLIVLILVNSSHDNKGPEVDDSAYIGIETIMVMNAKKYVINNKLEINEIGKYLSLNYLNLIVKEEYDCNSDSGVQIKKVNKEIIYTPYLVCDEYQSTAIKEVINDNEKVKELELVGSNPYFITKSYNELGYNIDDKYTVNIVGINDIEPGVNLIKYNVLKSGDYYKTVNRIVIAESIRGSYPELVLEGKETMTIPKGSTYVEPGYKAIDKIDGTITDKVVVNNNIDTNKAGTYAINYSITNNKKLTTTVNRTIIVNDSDLKLNITNNVQTIDKKANIVLTITGSGYLKTVLPNKEENTSNTLTYTVYKNGTYTFTIYDTNNNSETYDVKISTLDQTPPILTCSGIIDNGKTTLTIGASEFINYYLYGNIKSKNNSMTFNKEIKDMVVKAYDLSGNEGIIACSLNDIFYTQVESKFNGVLSKSYKSDTLKMNVIEKGSTIVSYVWAKDPYNQFHKSTSTWGSNSENPVNILNKAVNSNNLSNKALIGVNGSGFYILGVFTPDCSGKNYRNDYNYTTEGPLVITEGRVVRNWYFDLAIDNKRNDSIYGITPNGMLQSYQTINNYSEANRKKLFDDIINSGIRNTVTFRPTILINGTEAKDFNNSNFLNGNNKRQIFCQINRNNFMFLTSTSISKSSIISILKSNKCQTAVNFDGGPSIALMYKEPAQSINLLMGADRNIAEVVYFSE